MPAGQILQAEHGPLGLIGELVERARGAGLAPGHAAELAGECDQLVLRTVMQVTLDTAALLVLRGDQPLARILRLPRAGSATGRG